MGKVIVEMGTFIYTLLPTVFCQFIEVKINATHPINIKKIIIKEINKLNIVFKILLL
jgi:hypothetical protein